MSTRFTSTHLLDDFTLARGDVKRLVCETSDWINFDVKTNPLAKRQWWWWWWWWWWCFISHDELCELLVLRLKTATVQWTTPRINSSHSAGVRLWTVITAETQ